MILRLSKGVKMKNKTILLIVLPISTIILGLVLNFPEALMGSAASTKNLIVTLVYLATWILV